MISELGFEYLPLLSHIENKPSTTGEWRMRVKISLDLARGLDHMHRNNIVHGYNYYFDIMLYNFFFKVYVIIVFVGF